MCRPIRTRDDGGAFGAIYSPTHPLWSHEQIDDERVTTRGEAERNVDEALTRLFDAGLVMTDDDYGDLDDEEGFLAIKTADVDEYERVTV